MRWMLVGGPLAAVQMIVFDTVVSIGRPGYDPARNWVSQLSLGPGGWANAVNLAVCGGWLILCAAGLRRRSRAAGLVLVCGLCLVLVAVVPTDPGIGYPPGTAARDTVVGAVHKAVSIVLGAAGIVAAARLGREARRPVAGTAVAAFMGATFVAASVLVLLDAGGVLPGAPSGLLERVALYTGLVWIAVLAVGRLRHDAPPAGVRRSEFGRDRAAGPSTQQSQRRP